MWPAPTSSLSSSQAKPSGPLGFSSSSSAAESAVRHQFEVAIENIPRESRSAYELAVRIAPETVQTESPLRLFLKRDNALAAAARLANYWEHRSAVFGGRAFQPLRPQAGALSIFQAMTYALDDAAISLLQKDILVQLPEDDMGNIVLFCDWSKIPNWQNHKNDLMKCLFYWNDVLMHNEKAITDGVVGINFLDMTETNELTNFTPILDMVVDALVVQVKQVHVCTVANGRGQLDECQNTSKPAIEQIFSRYPSCELFVHIASGRPASIAKQLSRYGFRRESLPAVVGGTLHSNAAADTETSDTNSPEERASKRRSLNPLVNDTAISISGPLSLAEDRSGLNRRSQTNLSAPAITTNPLVDPHFMETPAVAAEGLKRIAEAIELLPFEAKAAYLTALNHAPLLVQLESNPFRYLRYAEYDSWAAAYRLCKYWTKRVELFRSRAFLPLTISSPESALDDQELDVIANGHMSLLPNDETGKPVLMYFPERRRQDSALTRMRVAFYYHSVLCENDRSQQGGYQVVLPLGMSPAVRTKLDGTIREFVEFVLSVFPTYVFALHLINVPSGIGQRLFYEVVLPLALRMIGGAPAERAVVHVGEKPVLVQRLGCYGVSPMSVPDAVGGVWTHANHLQWLPQRQQVERERYRSIGASALPKITSSYGRAPDLGAQGRIGGRIQSSLPSIVSSSSQAENYDVLERCSQEMQGLIDPYSADLLERCSQEMQVLIDSIPADETRAYKEALQRCPVIVATESRTFAFLRCSLCDIKVAASQLVKYWKLRKDVFGELAFLPLDQTGDGALNKKDLSLLGSRLLLSLPTDGTGRAVLFFDGSQVPKSAKDSRIRCIWYLFSIASEVISAQTEGIVLIYALSDPSLDRSIPECLDVVLGAVPVIVSDVHVLSSSAAQDRDQDVTVTSNFMVQYFRNVARNKVVLHQYHPGTVFATKLSNYGLKEENLPKCCGGKLGFDNFFQWQELRIRYEWNLPPGASSKNASLLPFDFSHVKALSEFTEEEKMDRKRKLNVIHSRRKRERDRIEGEVLAEQVAEERKLQLALKSEGSRLQDLLMQAEALLFAYGHSS